MFGILSLVGKVASSLFGSGSNGKGLVGSVSDVADKWIPSAETIQKNSIEDLKAGDASQDSARAMQLISHESWFDIFVDALNRMPRPLFTGWAFGILCGWWAAPDMTKIDPLVLNMIWTILTFWFGSRVVFKDVPNAIAAFKAIKVKAEVKKKKKQEESVDPFEEDD